MVTPTTLASSASGLLLLAAVAMSGCTPRPDGPGPAAEKFFGALAVGDTATAAQLSDNPNEAREALNAAWAGLQASRLRHADPQRQVRRGHRHGRLSIHLAPAQEPDLDLRRPAENGARRGALGGPVDHHRPAPQTGRAPDVRAAGRCAAPRLGERIRRQRRAGAGLPVPLHAGRHPGRIRSRPDRDGARDRGRPAPLQRRAERPAAARRAGELGDPAGGPGDAASRRQRQGLPGDRPAARRRDHPPARDPAHRPAFRVGSHDRGEEGRGGPTRRRAGLAGGQRQPERCRSRSAARGAGVTGAFDLDHDRPDGAKRRPARGGYPRRQSHDGGDQAVDRGDPRDRPERGRRRRGPTGHHRPVPAGVDVQDGHRRCRHRPRHGHPQHHAGLPGPCRHRTPHHPQLRRLRPRRGADVAGRSPVPATPPSPSSAAGCRRAG